MTLMLILGAGAAFYGLLLLFRCAKFALPVFAGLGLALHLRDLGYGWSILIGSGLIAGGLLLGLGRHLASGSAPLPIRLAVLLLFAGAAASAGYQAGMALAELGDLDGWTQRGLAILTGLVAGIASWRDLLSPGADIERPVVHT
ncbi:hypothetical protein [Sphingopyxis sp. 550A]